MLNLVEGDFVLVVVHVYPAHIGGAETLELNDEPTHTPPTSSAKYWICNVSVVVCR